MNESNAQEFNSLMDVTWEIYPKQLSSQAKRLYWESLKRFSFADIQSAFSRHIQNPDNGHFPPKPADIIRLISGSTQTASAVAWTNALNAVKHVGPYRTVVFDNPITHAVISDMGGWISFCGMQESEEPFIAKDFERRYAGYALREKLSYPKQMIGLTDAHNQGKTFQRGKYIPEITYVGNVERAKLVHKGGTDRKAGLSHITLALPASKDVL